MPKTWFITGASTGLGREWAEAALERGDQVVATARTPADFDPLADRYGEAVLPLQLDVTDRAAAFQTVQEAAKYFGGLDIVINNAGYGHFGMVEELAEDEIRAVMETNYFGTLWVTQAALPIFRKQGRGHLIQVTSEGGVMAYPGLGAYNSTKWAVEGLTSALVQEVQELGLHITLVEPGPYRTSAAAGARQSGENAAYAHIRARAGSVFGPEGDPRATRAAILQLADADQPPLRLFLGKTSLDQATADYANRLATWAEWQPVATAAFG